MGQSLHSQFYFAETTNTRGLARLARAKAFADEGRNCFRNVRRTLPLHLVAKMTLVEAKAVAQRYGIDGRFNSDDCTQVFGYESLAASLFEIHNRTITG